MSYKDKSELEQELSRSRQRVGQLERVVARLQQERRAAAPGRSAEEALQSEERFRAVLKNSPIVVFSQDRQLRFTWVHNPLPVFQLQAQDVIGKTDADLFSAADASRMMEKKRQVLASGVGLRYQIVTSLGGRQRCFDTSLEPLRDSGGDIVGITGVAVDITEQKLGEAAVRESEEKYRALFEQSKDAIFLASLDGGLLDVNPAGVAMSGYNRQELLSMNVGELYVDPQDRLEYLKILQERGFVRDYEVDMKNKFGEKRRVQISANIVRDQQGRSTAIRGTLRDITEKRNLERQLQEAQKLEAVGLLAGGIAHDFNNSLMVIQGNAELGLMELADGQPLRETLSAILEASRKSAQLVQQLLAFSRRQILNPELIDTAGLLAKIVKILERVLPERIELRLAVPSGLGNVYADPGALEQVVMNLSINARDAMPNGGALAIDAENVSIGRAFIGKHPEAVPGEYVRIAIADNGSGMDQEMLSHIFEPFFTAKSEGAGLGLSIVYGIVKQLGGWLRVESEPGRGSRFEVYLPLRDQAVGLAGEQEARAAAAHRGSETVLIAEDQAEVRDIFATLLKSLGYGVLSAADGLEALTLFKAHRHEVDLVLIDVVMPGLRGADACRKMRALAPGLPCLFITGYREEGAASLAEQPPADVLHKPIAVDELAGKVRDLLDRRAV